MAAYQKQHNAVTFLGWIERSREMLAGERERERASEREREREREREGEGEGGGKAKINQLFLTV